ncbi:RNA-binding S4 domain and Pseudouridine synthase, RsuA/RluB/C/D/E/F domain and Pseudouridine synthase, RluC/RluD family and Pseudouridine synthase, catalytic domain-containing protein [Strongyloides ratti]|uniref:Pseudouridine synthase n=1 Tax=Strongyloides ratti TaxID=34506 RepID=A0A090LGA7_STRRB|nr:RNA-binding S4 domain and Pseudouridine synthase, RsuA/RluB/C/D/E/F domain and Pseudouridine synthase, RluC/RluD family and Pseudouridine synthase, catalytic domain-containing protein [Strongyloides ratti]CEF66555.1 RNA-binding S4 domain and Pseudouridine synthase, RsuA/RluB/C/D/E/F domain and Pseudouridine synthase, RluC/RluD family and Pseudouridine synthase, catalytic domain-containing protein [Strongyloides ratti]
MTSENIEKNPRKRKYEEINDFEMKYIVKEGIRYLEPYWCTYKTRAKGRWVNRKLLDVFTSEFVSTNPYYTKLAIKTGRMFVNGNRITNLDYVIKNSDYIVHVAHRHEHEILDKKIEIIDDNENYFVINKPPSLPVHACGKYCVHSIIAQLRIHHGLNNLRVLHRLDKDVSGVLIFAKNYEADKEFKFLMESGGIHKEYIALVEGEFPDHDIICEQPIGKLVLSMGIQCVRKDGKAAKSTFTKLWTDGKKSLVSCKIESGRTHQIRVHLQYIGYPIINDKLYNSTVWGESKGKNAEYGKDMNTLSKAVQDSHKSSLWHEKPNLEFEENMKKWANGDMEPPIIDIKDTNSLSHLPNFDPFCVGCNIGKKKLTLDNFMLYLHCIKYETDKWKYEAPFPSWADISFLEKK